MNYKKRPKNIIIGSLFLIITSGALASCNAATGGQIEVRMPTSTESPAATADISSTDPVNTEETVQSPGTETAPAPVPTTRGGLESTDPATVNLASGEIQLIEAFAFW